MAFVYEPYLYTPPAPAHQHPEPQQPRLSPVSQQPNPHALPFGLPPHEFIASFECQATDTRSPALFATVFVYSSACVLLPRSPLDGSCAAPVVFPWASLVTWQRAISTPQGGPVPVVVLPSHPAASIPGSVQDAAQLFCADGKMHVLWGFGAGTSAFYQAVDGAWRYATSYGAPAGYYQQQPDAQYYAVPHMSTPPPYASPYQQPQQQQAPPVQYAQTVAPPVAPVAPAPVPAPAPAVPDAQETQVPVACQSHMTHTAPAAYGPQQPQAQVPPQRNGSFTVSPASGGAAAPAPENVATPSESFASSASRTAPTPGKEQQQMLRPQDQQSPGQQKRLAHAHSIGGGITKFAKAVASGFKEVHSQLSSSSSSHENEQPVPVPSSPGKSASPTAPAAAKQTKSLSSVVSSKSSAQNTGGFKVISKSSSGAISKSSSGILGLGKKCSQEKEEGPVDYDTAMSGAAVVEPDKMPVRVEPTKLTFGLGSRQAPVDAPITETLTLVNATKESWLFAVVCKQPYAKCEVTASPASGKVPKGKSVEVVVTLVARCTSQDIAPDVSVVVWRGKGEERRSAVALGVKLESLLTTRLDPDELSVFSDPIGDGSFGTVWRGEYRGLEVAVKLLKNQEFMTPQMAADFESEVAVMERIRHPCIVNFVGAVRMPGRLSIVTEFCDCGSLGGALEKKSASWGLRLKSLYDCARGMTFLHASNILHRDLKPDNLLMVSLEVRSPVVAKISDFGTTREVSKFAEKMDCTKGIGTPIYMAPEILNGEAYDKRADVYSFGIMMYSVIAQQTPYAGDADMTNSFKFANLVIQGRRPKLEDDWDKEYVKLMSACWGEPSGRPSFADIVPATEAMFKAELEKAS
eukprot:m51a1_g13905 putative serine-threonine protein (861) ;mRNA; f:757455-760641